MEQVADSENSKSVARIMTIDENFISPREREKGVVPVPATLICQISLRVPRWDYIVYTHQDDNLDNK